MPEKWFLSFCFDKPQDVAQVSVRAGVLVAGGAQMHRMLRGNQGIQSREAPEGEPIRAVAVEPVAPYRCAVASDHGIAVFDFKAADGGHQSLRFPPGEPKPVALAWGKVKGRWMLHVLRDDQLVVRPAPPNELEELPLPGALTLANDDEGTVAIVTDGSPPLMYVSDDGEQWNYRGVETSEPIRKGAEVHAALGRTGTAISIEGEGVWTSKGRTEPFTPCELLALAGAIALDERGALYAAVHEPLVEAIVRVDPDGTMEHIGELASKGGAVPRITSLAWDASRQTLWGASSVGLLLMRAPKAKMPS
jgi:hypothetical protein